jgi:hypothetical protein
VASLSDHERIAAWERAWDEFIPFLKYDALAHDLRLELAVAVPRHRDRHPGPPADG